MCTFIYLFVVCMFYCTSVHIIKHTHNIKMKKERGKAEINTF